MDEQSRHKDVKTLPTVDGGEYLTTNEGVRVSDDRNTLRAGARGPALLEDHLSRQKISHFDHERIPERVVHARGNGAHGFFQVYESQAELTKAAFLQDPSVKTPMFVRFSTVLGSRGAADTAREVRGFAARFYTEAGNFDLVANNIPVFFIQDAIKFPDLIHAAKPEPHHEIPQASTAHDTFWDWISLTPESLHMVMWAMSDRTLPRSYAMVEGAGVNTFRLVNEAGVSRFVKFHWKPLLGVHSLVWDEAQKLGGVDPDFLRRDLWEAIEKGDYPEYEFAIQVIEEADEFNFPFDILDATKIWPEELVPLRRIGKLTLDRNPENYFAETEQIAFQTNNIVPGIDFSDDPLLHGRNFSYLDTQLTRLGGPNFAQIPINQPIAPVANNQQDGFMRMRNKPGRVNYEPNSLAGGLPMAAPTDHGGFASYPAPVEGRKVRERSASFADHYSQATMFYRSQADWEQEHIVEALRFEIGRVETKVIRERMVAHLARIDGDLAERVARGIGVAVPPAAEVEDSGLRAPETSMANTVMGEVKGRRVAVLAADGFDYDHVAKMQMALVQAGIHVEIVAPNLGQVTSADDAQLSVDKTLLTAKSLLYDAVFVPGGAASLAALLEQGAAILFVAEAYKHGKAIAATGEGVELLAAAGIGETPPAGAKANGAKANGAKAPAGQSVIAEEQPADVKAIAAAFIEAIGRHRDFTRRKEAVPA